MKNSYFVYSKSKSEPIVFTLFDQKLLAYLVILFISLMFNFIVTIGLLHWFQLINIIELLDLSSNYNFDLYCLNNITEPVNEKFNCYKSIEHKYTPITYFEPLFDFSKYKHNNYVSPLFKSKIIDELDKFYDMNHHIIKENNYLIDKVNRLTALSYQDKLKYFDLKNTILKDYPLN